MRGMATWKIERWLEEVYPGAQRLIDEYKGLPSRELVIVACAVLDVALAAVLEKRLNGPPKEIAEFLGADLDGRAPLASFGARIQLARLLGIIRDEHVATLRALKNLRNVMAHRVKADLTDARSAPHVLKLFDSL